MCSASKTIFIPLEINNFGQKWPNLLISSGIEVVLEVEQVYRFVNTFTDSFFTHRFRTKTFYDSNNRTENDMEKWELMKNE